MCDLSFCWQLGRPLDIQTGVFDITDLTSPLPRCHYAVAADLLYQKSTAVALAKRCVEALRSPECEGVIVGDLGRPGRDAFLQTLIECGVSATAARFRQRNGWTAGTQRHELVSTSSAAREGDEHAPESVSIGLMRLQPSDLVGS